MSHLVAFGRIGAREGLPFWRVASFCRVCVEAWVGALWHGLARIGEVWVARWCGGRFEWVALFCAGARWGLCGRAARHGVVERCIVVWRIELKSPMISFPFLAVGLYQEWAENARKMAGFSEGGKEGRRS